VTLIAAPGDGVDGAAIVDRLLRKQGGVVPERTKIAGADVRKLATPGGLGLAVYLGAIPTALAYVLFSRGLRGLTSGETATLVLAEPLTAAALGVVALGEQPSVAAGAGAALVLAGLAILALPGRRPIEPAVAPA
jgi:DME family drug/metabolite transporter